VTHISRVSCLALLTLPGAGWRPGGDPWMLTACRAGPPPRWQGVAAAWRWF